MKFAIITTSYKRPELLLKNFESVCNQSHVNLTHIIINDSPDFDYAIFENNSEIKKAIKNQKLIYIKNEINKGSNFSKNMALKYIDDNLKDIGYITFLDDDDYFHKNSLQEINLFLENKKEKEINWLVTNRVLLKNESLNIIKKLTNNKTHKNKLSYFWDYLLFKKFTGDATHFIKKDIVVRIKFSEFIKNGEEWFYFLKVAKLAGRFIYEDQNTTYTEGYLEGGLTNDLKSKYNSNTILFWKEIFNFKNNENVKQNLNFKVLFYMLLRSAFCIFKRVAK